MAPCGTVAMLVAMRRCAVCGPRGAFGGNTTGAANAAPFYVDIYRTCLLYTSPSPRDGLLS
eukprot:2688922-Pleurochrysis_carterae.AAC.1